MQQDQPRPRPGSVVMVKDESGNPAWKPCLVHNGEPMPLGLHSAREAAEAAFDVAKICKALHLGASDDFIQSMKLHRPVQSYTQHPHWQDLIGSHNTIEDVCSLLAATLAAEFLQPAGASTQRQLRRSRALQGRTPPLSTPPSARSPTDEDEDEGPAAACNGFRERQVAGVPATTSWAEFPAGSSQHCTALSKRAVLHGEIWLPEWIRTEAFQLTSTRGSIAVVPLESAPSNGNAASDGTGASHQAGTFNVAASSWDVVDYHRPTGKVDVRLKLPRNLLAGQVEAGDLLVVRPLGVECVGVGFWRAGSQAAQAFHAAEWGVKRRKVAPGTAERDDLQHEGAQDMEEHKRDDEESELEQISAREEEEEEVEEGEDEEEKGQPQQQPQPQRSGPRWLQYPPGSGQYCFVVSKRAVTKKHILIPAWMRTAGFLGLGGASSVRMVLEASPSLTSAAGAAAREAINVQTSGVQDARATATATAASSTSWDWSVAKHNRPNGRQDVMLWLPTDFIQSQQIKEGDVLAIQGRGAGWATVSIWPAGSAAEQAFHTFQTPQPSKRQGRRRAAEQPSSCGGSGASSGKHEGNERNSKIDGQQPQKRKRAAVADGGVQGAPGKTASVHQHSQSASPGILQAAAVLPDDSKLQQDEGAKWASLAKLLALLQEHGNVPEDNLTAYRTNLVGKVSDEHLLAHYSVLKGYAMLNLWQQAADWVQMHGNQQGGSGDSTHAPG